MKQKKVQNLLLAITLAASMLTGCGTATTSNSDNSAKTEASAEDTTKQDTKEEAEESKSDATDEKEAEADQLLVDLTGSYQELWPVILDEEYESLWLENCADLVGEENAQSAYEKLVSMVSGEIYGAEAVEAYADENGVYDCEFTEGVQTLEFDGDTSTIKGYDAEDKELFSHTYHYVGMEEVRGLYEFESDDADSGEFTYFCIAPDTSATTYHIELRYGSDLDELAQYDAGNYAYWLASGISTDYDETMIENCIKLFCTENLSEQ